MPLGHPPVPLLQVETKIDIPLKAGVGFEIPAPLLVWGLLWFCKDVGCQGEGGGATPPPPTLTLGTGGQRCGAVDGRGSHGGGEEQC